MRARAPRDLRTTKKKFIYFRAFLLCVHVYIELMRSAMIDDVDLDVAAVALFLSFVFLSRIQQRIYTYA